MTRPGRAPSRLDPFAPDWLVRILVPKAAPVPWADALRVAVTIVTPLAAAVAIAQTALGVYAAMGALAGALADRGGSRADRIARVLAGVGFGVVGLVAGRASAGEGVVPVLVIAALAVVSALVSTVSATLSFGGLQLLVHAAVASGLPAGPGYGEVVVAFLLGGSFAMLASFTQTLVTGAPDVDRDAVMRVVRAIAALLRHPAPDPAPGGSDIPGHVAVRRELTDALDAAYDRLLRARAVSPGRREDLQALTGVLVSLSPLVSASVATAGAGRPAPDLADVVDRLGDAVADDHGWDPQDSAPTADDADVTATRSLLREAVLAGVDRAASALGDRPAAPATPAGALPAAGPERTTPKRLLLGASAWTFAARLSLTLAVAEVVRQVVPLERPYWIVLTAALVLKPDFGSVFARGVQRTLGTLVGVVIGAAVLYLVPSGPWVLLPMLGFAAVVPVAMARNYGMFSTFLTPLVLLLLDFGRPVDGAVAGQRLLDTVVGAGVVLVVGYLCWPQTWRPHLARRVAAAAETLGGFTRAAFGPDRAAAGRERRRAYRALSDARQALQAALSEPPPVSGRAAAWWPVVVQLERAADAVTTAMVVGRSPGRAPAEADVAAVVAGLDDLAAGVRQHTRPRAVTVSDRSPLAGVAGDVEGARRMLLGPQR